MYDEICKNKRMYELVMNPTGNVYPTGRKDLSPEEEIIVQKYHAREEELYLEDSDRRAKIFEELGRNLGQYWD